MSSLKEFLKKKDYHWTKLNPLPTNHLEVEVVLNGVPSSFILDTGASATCIGIDFVEELGVIPSEETLVAAGAGNSEMEGHFSHDNILKIGSWKWKNMNLVLLDLSHVNGALAKAGVSPIKGIIGADVLQKGDGVIDYNKLRLFLKTKIYK
ncbi:retroviral-like aspartic protease family protein [Flavobacteriaceae bacterium]|nr:retroviral-like aspartic protease family protein [Flavobacteriaceae bacterium]